MCCWTCFLWDPILSDAPPGWTWVGDSVNPPCPCLGPQIDQKERGQQSGQCFGVDREGGGFSMVSPGGFWLEGAFSAL